MGKFIPVCTPVLDGNEKKYVEKCIETNWVSSLGEYIGLFEEAFSAYCDIEHGIACTNATSGLHAAMEALGIGPGDEVIIPDFTLIVSANTVLYTGATPVLADVDPKTWCIDPAKIEEKITPRTKAIMAVHMYGHPCDMVAIGEIAKRHNLYVVEDCAQGHGVEVNGQKVGGFGDVGVFSFYGNKLLTTGEGGMVLCRDAELAARIRILIDQGFEKPRFVHNIVGYNYRMTNIQAALGLAQTEKADEKCEKKRWIASVYNELLAGVPDITLPTEAPWAKNLYWMYGIVLGEGFGVGRDEFMQRLREKGVDTRAFFYPMHMQPVFQDKKESNYPDVSGDYPVSRWLGLNGFYVPSGLNLTREDIEFVVEKILEK